MSYPKEVIIMLSMYPACFYREENGYSVIFPGLDVATCGENEQDAMEMAVDCLAGYLWDAKHDGETVPDAPKLDEIDLKAVADGVPYESAFVTLVTVDVEEYAKKHFEKAVKKTLTIPAWLNELAIRNGVNFSQTLQDALREQLHVNS